jgi:hypothetical protein
MIELRNGPKQSSGPWLPSELYSHVRTHPIMAIERTNVVWCGRLDALNSRIDTLNSKVDGLEKKQIEDRETFPKVIDARCTQLLSEIKDFKVRHITFIHSFICQLVSGGSVMSIIHNVIRSHPPTIDAI